ncbi:hypothetical protein [Deinococcus hohokamensis]|uniref:Uncharacterized protein n=1 Tax=Deinococcus hohokamensis TaxID=309883 RepID=A0ABV9I6J3_9DEIO
MVAPFAPLEWSHDDAAGHEPFPGASMLIGLLVLMLVSVNLGGIFSLIMQAGRGEWPGALSAALGLAVLDAVGFWLIRQLRDQSP